MKISWETYALNLAEAASLRSEDPYVKVGACALDVDNRVLAVGYNGLASGKDCDDAFWKDRDLRRKFMIHAEANCLSMCVKGEVNLIAVTLLPCSYCATMIASYGVKKVVYREEYERDTKSKEIFDFYGILLEKNEK